MYKGKLAALMKPVNIWKRRLREMTMRPKAIAAFHAVLDAVLAHAATWNATHPQISKEETGDVTDKVSELKAWMLEEIEAQEKLAVNVDPVLTLTAIARKQNSLKGLVARLITKPKPVPVEEDDAEEEASVDADAAAATEGEEGGGGGEGEGEGDAAEGSESGDADAASGESGGAAETKEEEEEQEEKEL